MHLARIVTLYAVAPVLTIASAAGAQTLTQDLYLAAKASAMTYGVASDTDSHGPVPSTDTTELAKWYRDRLECNSWFQRYESGTEGLTYFVAARPGLVIVAFRGTFSEANRAMNLNGEPKLTNSGMPGVLSHTGWAAAVEKLYPTIKRQIQLRDQNRTARIIVTGHSMGGAIAGYVTYRLLLDGTFSRKGYSRLMSFGSPRFSAERIFTDKSLNEGLSTAQSKNLWLYSTEIFGDPKLLEWEKQVQAKGLLTFTTQRTGTMVDFRLAEIGLPQDTSIAHDYNNYVNIARKRAGL